jgi:hypothetical protein
MVRVFLQHESFARPEVSATGSLRPAEADRIDSLPFQLGRPQVDLLEAAKRLYSEGRYGDAIIYLYSYQLLELDKHQVIRLARGKTNRQYLREIRGRPALRNLLAETLVAFEDVFFGNRQLGQQQFESCWHRLDQFHSEIAFQTTSS